MRSVKRRVTASAFHAPYSAKDSRAFQSATRSTAMTDGVMVCSSTLSASAVTHSTKRRWPGRVKAPAKGRSSACQRCQSIVACRMGRLLVRCLWDVTNRQVPPGRRPFQAPRAPTASGAHECPRSGGDDLPSTADLSALPEAVGLRRLCRSRAMLDAILCPEWPYRYHSFNANWAAGEEMASMRDGCGDGYFILFTKAGAIMKGFAHESEAWRRTSQRGQPLPGMFDGVPEEFAGFLDEPAFSM